jgi:hypothetical protein
VSGRLEGVGWAGGRPKGRKIGAYGSLEGASPKVYRADWMGAKCAKPKFWFAHPFKILINLNNLNEWIAKKIHLMHLSA